MSVSHSQFTLIKCVNWYLLTISSHLQNKKVFFKTDKPLFSRQKLFDRKQTEQQSLPCDLSTILGTGLKILVCKNQIKGSDHSEWSISAHIAANTFQFDAFCSNSMLHTGFQQNMTRSLLRSSLVQL